MFIPLLILGAALAALFTWTTRRRLRRHAEPERMERVAWALYLVLAALIYVGFALLGGASVGWIAVELGGVLLYGALAALGGARWPLFVGLGWLAHVGWDLALHPGGHPGYVPGWYPPLCLGFDVLVGLTWLRRAWIARG
ncbi:MAG: hypothetical protein H6741_12855 [Alphaproteobacteria bacterium]|nr:hypothetical protein [Alphaproteobacteria bacterium]MCB9793605.1 hypothetical protein [Alphaproteobacteria bacterium]